MTKRQVKKRRRGLTDEHRSFIVQQLACFMGPSETAEAVNERFGLNVTRQAMERYDPHKHAGRRMAQKWRDLFEVTHAAFIEHVESQVPEVHKSVRIQELARASRTFKKRGNFIAMAAMLERIAKEVGGAFTNRTELTGRDRGPIKFAAIDDMTDDQIDAELRQIFGIDADADVHPAPVGKQ